MTTLRSALEKYLSMRKGLGYKYEQQTRRLASFVTFMEKRKARARSGDVARPPRSHSAVGRGTDRLAPVRADRPRAERRPPRGRCSRALHRQRAQGTMHAADGARSAHYPGMAQGACTEGSDSIVPQHARRPAQRRQRPVAPGKACAGRLRELPVVEVEAHVAARAQAQRGDGVLQAGVDCSVIALWLGHESIETTQVYHLALKEAALAKLKPYERGKRTRFHPNDRLLAFLEAL